MMSLLLLYVKVALTLALIPICIIVVVPVMNFSISLCAMYRGRYLNPYFIIRRQRNGSYSLRFLPRLGFYHLGMKKFHRYFTDAVHKFESGYPDSLLIGRTILFQSAARKERGHRLPRGWFTTIYRVMAVFLILFNIALYQRKKGSWGIADYIRTIYKRFPMEYLITKGKDNDDEC